VFSYLTAGLTADHVDDKTREIKGSIDAGR
jgi:hypothetical protein